MKKLLTSIAITCLLLTSCNSDDPYKVTPTSVGHITQDTKVSELDALFENDYVIDPTDNNSLSGTGAIEIYEKDGKQLLSLSPATAADSSKIKTVQIFDDRYETPEGISLKSTFGDIRKAYKISKIQTLLSSVVVFTDDINAYFTIDKKELAGELQFNREIKVSESQIPDKAKVKYFMVGW